MSEFQPFVMERMMSKHEQEVEYNLSESGEFIQSGWRNW